VRQSEGKINLVIPELLAELDKLGDGPPPRDPELPFVLSAGERRSDTANTIYRNPEWRKKGHAGSLRVSPQDAAALGLADGERARVSTRRELKRICYRPGALHFRDHANPSCSVGTAWRLSCEVLPHRRDRVRAVLFPLDRGGGRPRF
jgi:hypothetical protein